MSQTCHATPERARFSRVQAKELLNRFEAALIAATDRLFDALERRRSRHALGRLDERALRDLGLSTAVRDGSDC